MYVDNMGRPREVIEQQDAKAGNDVYLTIDRDLQIATYKLMEQQLAGIINQIPCKRGCRSCHSKGRI